MDDARAFLEQRRLLLACVLFLGLSLYMVPSVARTSEVDRKVSPKMTNEGREDAETAHRQQGAWRVMNGGGGKSSSLSHSISGSLNQTAIGASYNGHQMHSGYWYGVNFAPLAFSLISPVDNDTVSSPVVLEWETNGDPDAGDNVFYCVYYSTQIDFSDADSACCGSSSPVCTLSGLSETAYYWKVKAYDDWWTVRWSSETWRFYLGMFLRADADADLDVEMADAIFTLKHLYVPGSEDPPCMDAADSDDGGVVEMADAIYTLKYLYVPGAPPPPDPGPDNCGPDPTEDGLECANHPCMGGR